jgi:hypothetical protein
MGLPTPLKSGFTTINALTGGGLGLSKGTLFWTCFGGLYGKVFSSTDGFSWAERTDEMRVALGFDDGYGTYISSPVAIGDMFVCYVQRASGISPPLFTVAFNGTTWSKADVGSLINIAATNPAHPVKKANGLFFLLGGDGLYSGTDGLNWTKRLELPAVEPGGPTYFIRDMVFTGGVYYVVVQVSYAGGGTGTIRYTSSNLTSWTSYSTELPVGPFFSSLQRLFYAGGEFYLELLYYLLKSPDFITWSIVEGDTTWPLNKSVYPLGDGFLVEQTTPQNTHLVTWLPYSKNNIVDITTAFDENIASSILTQLRISTDSVILHNGYVFISGGVGPEGYVKAFRYEDTWDDGDPYPTRTGTILVIAGNDVAVIAGGFTNATATIQGTLRLDTSDGAFAARDVYLYNYVNGEKIAETVSDAVTGIWQFTQVAPGEYFVVGAAQGDDLNIPRDFDALGVITVV